MNPKIFYLGSALKILVISSALASCTVFSGRETAGEYVDDATVTSKINAQIINEPSLRSSQINVETMQDVVQLSGFVDSKKDKEKASGIAWGVFGVRSVRNNIIVR